MFRCISIESLQKFSLLGSLLTSKLTNLDVQVNKYGQQLLRHLSHQAKPTLSFSIIEDQERKKVSDKFNIELNDIQLTIGGHELLFNLTWLRDSCHCPKCTHQFSRQRIFTPKDFRREHFIVKEVEVRFKEEVDRSTCINFHGPDNKYLWFRWNDNHESVYCLNWLRHIYTLYPRPLFDEKNHLDLLMNFPQDDFYAATIENKPDVDMWSVSQLRDRLKPVHFGDLMDGVESVPKDPTYINANKLDTMSSRRIDALYSLTRQLVTLGIAKVTNVPLELFEVLKISQSMAYERPTGYGTVFNVTVEPSEEINLAYSSLEFDLHSDLTYRESSPGVQMLHCIIDSKDGGSSYFSDAFKAARSLQKTDPHLYQVLLKFPVTFVVRDPYRDVKFRRQKQVLALDFEGRLSEIYYSPFMLPPVGNRSDLKLFYMAIDKFTALLQSKENKFITKMAPGDLFIFHNRRILHGRSAYDANSNRRFFQGVYMDWDEIASLHEKLHRFLKSNL